MAKQPKTLGEKLKELRENYDMPQHQVATALNIDRSTYGYYELDKTRPSLETLVKLAHIYNVSPEQLLPDDPDSGNSVRLNQPSSLVRSLSKEERGLIAVYRTMTKEQKRLLREEIAKISKNYDA